MGPIAFVRWLGESAMNLETLKKDWELLAKRDALHAILTDRSRADGKWMIAEFMATGDAEIATVLNHLARIDGSPKYDGAALDFGCGVGRLTQALAQHFASCVGVDISPQMIHQAEALNRYAHCRYAATCDERLPFADASFSFIYSNIVLQHMPRRYATTYLREFVRLLVPGGVLVFGVQDSFAAPDLPSWLIRARHVLRIRSRVKLALGVRPGDMQMHCLPERDVRRALAAATIVDIQLTNTAAKDFNGKLAYLRRPPLSGYVGKQYCVTKLPTS
jgi:SAM-dependent methyltransferase